MFVFKQKSINQKNALNPYFQLDISLFIVYIFFYIKKMMNYVEKKHYQIRRKHNGKKHIVDIVLYTSHVLDSAYIYVALFKKYS